MDKLTIEEKAKRYDELSKEVKDFFDGKQKMYSDVGQTLSYLFPEFRDSEDERIRKSIISGMKALQENGKYTRFANIPVNNVIAWLEKQGEQKIEDGDKAILENWEGIVKNNKEKWQLSDWFVEATLLLVQKIKQIGLSKSIVDNNKTMLNACINTLRNVGHSHLASWLEKQGEQRSITIDADKMASKYSHTKDGDFGLPVNCQIRAYRQGVNDVLNLLLGIEKQGEQEEPQVYETENGEIITYSETDGYKVVEPKFKIGDWIIYKDNVWKICNISLKTYYELLTINNEVSTRRIEDVDKDCHLWTIQDAKDGDVLVGNYGTFIFMGEGYCGVLSDNTFIRSTGNNEWTKSLHPATKKQRDTLFKKMREAGYEFDFEQKELKKIDNEEVNGEDYGIDSLYHAQRILEKTLGKVDGYQSDDGILEHKCAISAVKKLYEQKPAKVESKFHEGEWLCENEHNNYARFIQILEIVNVQGKERYRISRDIHNDEDIVEFDFVEKYYHKFDIKKDLKDGDVLTNDFNEIFIFKNINEDIVISHCSIINRTSDAIANSFDEAEVGSLSVVNFYPATKEQRDTLMKAMADAGYTFDFKKKEVRKIKQNPAEWSEEDELHIRELESLVKQAWVTADSENDKETIHKMSDLAFFLKTLKPQLKREWSKEDEEMIEGLNNCLDELEEDNGWYYVYVNNKNIKLYKIRNWLKSLRPQNHITDEKLAQAKKDAYNDALDKIEYHSGNPTFDDGWSAAIDYIRKKSLRP